MIAALSEWRDRVLGRGDAACTVPVLDGALKPNQVLEAAAPVHLAEDPRDLVSDGRRLWLADGPCVIELAPQRDGEMQARELLRCDAPVTALCALPDAQGGGLAVAVGGRELRLVGGRYDGRAWKEADGRPFVAVNAIAASADGLIVSDASAENGPDDWQRDLMTLGRSGRVVRLDPPTGKAQVLAEQLHHAFGVAARGSAVWVSESWRHRVVALGAGDRPSPVLDHLPGYPSRLTPAARGGWWLTVFACRTQLVEFVLREPAFRSRMIAAMPPELWIAPQLRPAQSFLEPLQSGGVKQMGVLKPWAPPRSYGLVIRLDAAGRPISSLHSRVGGRHHGIVAAVECAQALYVLSRGARCVLRLALAGLDIG